MFFLASGERQKGSMHGYSIERTQNLWKTTNILQKENEQKNYEHNKRIRINKSKFSLSTRRDGDVNLTIWKGGDATNNTVAILLFAGSIIMGGMVIIVKLGVHLI